MVPMRRLPANQPEDQVRQTSPLARAAALALELLIVTVAVFAGAALAAKHRIIPKALIHLPDISFARTDTLIALKGYLVACALTFVAARLIAGWGVFGTARRAAIEVYALVTGIVAAALYMFFLTPVNFSPELLLQSTLIAIVGLLIAFLTFGPGGVSVGARAVGFVGNLFGLLKRPAIWAVLLFAASPLYVGHRFGTDRNFANWVTRLRVNANVSQDRPFAIVNGLGNTHFTTPIMVQFAKSDPHTAFVLTRGGELWRADYPGGQNAKLLMNIGGDVGYVEMENGALGFDLHPEFGKAGSKNAGFAYIYFTEYRKDGQTNHLNRYDLSAPTPEARAASVLPLIAQGRGNDGYHNAGMVGFGPDGMLYLSVGEMALEKCHQRIDCSLVGGILRLDVDNRGGSISRPILRQPERGHTANYMIPLDNPWADRGAAALGEYYAMGLRNPFRFGFDPADGQMWAGEVGSTEWEEVNHVRKGGNYQFPYIEGFTPQPRFAKPAQIVGTEHPPVLTYHHTAFMRSVIGGSVYRADRFPQLKGKYIFGDNYSGEIMTIPLDKTRVDTWDVIARSPDVAQRGLTAMVVAPDGQVLVPIMGETGHPAGMIGMLVPAGSKAGSVAIAAQKAAAASEAAVLASGAVVKPVSLAVAKSLYNTNCARCHGANGKGNAQVAESLNDYIPNFTDPAFHKWFSDPMIRAVLHGGGGAIGRSTAMPPWDGVLKPEEIEGVKDYVRTFNSAKTAAGAKR